MRVLKGTDKPPPKRQVHLLADFVELRCVASESGAFSAEELQDARKRAERDAPGEEEVSIRELFFDDEDEIDAEAAVALDIASGDTEPAVAVAPDDPLEEVNREAGESARDDLRELEASDVVKHLRYRVETFGDDYPFRLREDAVLELREELSPRQWLYLLLLAASNLKHIRRKSDESKLTTYFELIAPSVLRGHLGPAARVELFGTSTTEDAGHYEGTLWNKLQALKDDLRLPLYARNTDAEVNDANVGDHGVDVVAWFPFDDPASNFLTIFAQCACGRAWMSKMDEPTEARWNPIFNFRSPLVNMLLIPYCFRHPDGEWYSQLSVHKGVLLDRTRIMHSLPLDAALPIAEPKWPRELLEALVGDDASAMAA